MMDLAIGALFTKAKKAEKAQLFGGAYVTPAQLVAV
jgi:hypothetical protein